MTRGESIWYFNKNSFMMQTGDAKKKCNVRWRLSFDYYLFGLVQRTHHLFLHGSTHFTVSFHLVTRHFASGLIKSHILQVLMQRLPWGTESQVVVFDLKQTRLHQLNVLHPACSTHRARDNTLEYIPTWVCRALSLSKDDDFRSKYWHRACSKSRS